MKITNQESGRSLLEVVGVMAIAGIMAVAVLGGYNVLRNRTIRNIAMEELEQVAKNTKLLMGHRKNYSGLSVDYLVKSGALKTSKAPIGGEWSVAPSFDNASFSINLSGLTSGECDYLASVKTEWATRIIVNGSDFEPVCISSDNMVSFIVE